MSEERHETKRERKKKIIKVVTCYSELLLVTNYCNKLLKFFKFGTINVGVFLVFVWLK